MIIYLVKTILFSAVFFGYYLLFMRDRKIHAISRAFLLLSVCASLLMPLLDVFNVPAETMLPDTAVQTLVTLSGSIKYPAANSSLMSIVPFCYAAISLLLLVRLTYGLYKISCLSRGKKTSEFVGYKVVGVEEGMMPFTFLNKIYWPANLSFNDELGSRIFQHEICHAREKHSYDILVCEIISSIFWVNPFFRIIKNELSVIHEFRADAKALESGDTKTFAKMLLHCFSNNVNIHLASYSLKTSVKRRFKMIQNTEHSKMHLRQVIRSFPILLASTLFLAACTSKSDDLLQPSSVNNLASQVKQSEPDSVYADVTITGSSGLKETHKGWIKVIRSQEPKASRWDSVYGDISAPGMKTRKAWIKYLVVEK